MLLTILPMMCNDWLEDFLLPIGICVILPVAIVALVMATSRHETDRKTEVMLKAIEAGQPIPVEAFSKNGKKPLTKKEQLLKRFHSGCICTGLGIAFIALGFVKNMPGPSFGPIGLGAILLAVGVGLIASFIVSRKVLSEELEAEKNKNIKEE